MAWRLARPWRWSLACVVAASLLASHGPPAGAAREDQLQGTFAAAASEFGVPREVLLAVSYATTRWEDHRGAPSTAAGYGLMHLTDAPDAWWSTDDTAMDPAATPPPGVAGQHTLVAAAGLLGASPDELKNDPTLNVRGGAALLAQYARETIGRAPSRLGQWYGAIAAYSGSPQADVALGFADSVVTTIRRGAARTTSDGQVISLAPEPLAPDVSTAEALHLAGSKERITDCPDGLVCGLAPAIRGSYHPADRPGDGLDVRYIVLHDTETSRDEAITIFQDPTIGTSAHYVIRSADGLVVQTVPPTDVAYHAGNWYFNSHSIGVEHEGKAVEGATWYSEQLYQASATLVRYLAQKYGVPLDRAHIIGHDNVPGQTPGGQTRMHWDPGPFWDWAHYMELLGAPLAGGGNPNVVTIAPSFATNTPLVRYCEPKKKEERLGPDDIADTTNCRDLPPQPANFVPLRVAPSFDAPLIADPTLANLQTVAGQGTSLLRDWGDTAVTGEQFYRADTQGDWDAIFYGGKKAWFYNPGHANTLSGNGLLVTPRSGRSTICVYGEAYPDVPEYPDGVAPQAMVPLDCGVAAGQVYVASDQVTADYLAHGNTVVRGSRVYYQIFFNHRLAFVRADDVEILPGR